ncbi:permease [Vibrio sp. UCD-FRSSP16_10]|uniref:YgjV family protein n=1 Tax=unclassified Vibrio TaxID=2614977 RepID=UPI0007FE9F91|nr:MULTISPECIES: YgjV family protein [unclassified Vibrio]OBT13995.1 permease [Vibrio sp. UCD-FRSSP16_30]OBT22876.1 permease [Vibrio sp. UCD-FRSSP16_10]
MMELHFWGQIVGFISFAIGIAAFYQKDDKKLKIIMVIFNINHLFHYLLIGSVMSAVSTLLSALRTTTAIFSSSKWIAYIFILISVVIGCTMIESWHDVLPIMGSAIGTYCIFLLKGIPMRLGFLLGSFCWLASNIIVGSIGGTLLEIVLIGSNIVTIYKMWKMDERSPVIANRINE